MGRTDSFASLQDREPKEWPKNKQSYIHPLPLGVYAPGFGKVLSIIAGRANLAGSALSDICWEILPSGGRILRQANASFCFAISKVHSKSQWHLEAEAFLQFCPLHVLSLISSQMSKTQCMTMLKQDSAETYFSLLDRNVQQGAVLEFQFSQGFNNSTSPSSLKRALLFVITPESSTVELW